MLLRAKKTPRIAEADSSQVLEILSKGLLLLGIKGDKLPTGFELTYMVQMIRQDYGNLPIGEFQLAFELCVKDKLDEKAETYQNFSVLYLSRMMTSYARWAIKNTVYERPEVKQIQGKKLEDDEVIEMAFDSYKRTRQFDSIFMALKAFNILNGRGLLDTSKNIVTLTENELKRRIVDVGSKKEIKAILENDDEMELYCRRMAVALYFKSLL